MNTAVFSLDEGLARSLVETVRRYNDANSDEDAERMQETENLILDRLGVSLDETEQGLTNSAVRQIEAFVSEHTGHYWTYSS